MEININRIIENNENPKKNNEKKVEREKKRNKKSLKFYIHIERVKRR
jgi:hypothetical protein